MIIAKPLYQNPQAILDTLGHKRDESEATLAVKRHRLVTVQQEIAKQLQKRSKALDSYLDDKYTPEELNEKVAEIGTAISDFETEQTTLNVQIKGTEISEIMIESVEEFCRKRQEELDYFTFEDKRELIEVLAVTGVVVCSDSPNQDRIRLSGYLPILGGDEPPELSEGIPWMLTSLFLAFSLDIGYLALSSEIRHGRRSFGRFVAFVVLAAAMCTCRPFSA